MVLGRTCRVKLSNFPFYWMRGGAGGFMVCEVKRWLGWQSGWKADFYTARVTSA